MGTTEAKSKEHALFVFSFQEHKNEEVWNALQGGDEEELLQVFAGLEWELVRTGVPGAFATRCSADIENVAALKECLREMTVDTWDVSEAVVEVPFDKLSALMKKDGWRFVGGSFLEFDGNHNDTEIRVVLER
jgi:hypothetical protein